MLTVYESDSMKHTVALENPYLIPVQEMYMDGGAGHGGPARAQNAGLRRREPDRPVVEVRRPPGRSVDPRWRA